MTRYFQSETLCSSTNEKGVILVHDFEMALSLGALALAVLALLRGEWINRPRK